MESVAIIGGGPSGIVAARYLKSQGFVPVIYESHSEVGGQWACMNPNSGVWPQMRTNTARMVTRFSDLDHGDDISLFPKNTDIQQYLKEYLDVFDLAGVVHINTRLTSLFRVNGTWHLELNHDGEVEQKTFDKVVIATGAYNNPDIPNIEGLAEFSGDCGVIHAFHYDNPERYRGKKVLVAGGNISSLEIASDLAMLGTESVTTTMRRQRYVMPKLITGTPTECFAFTRRAALWQEQASAEEWAAETREFILKYSGNPAWYGAPEPDEDVRVAGTTGSQHFLHLIAENRITCKPWIAKVEGRVVHFTDGSQAEFDGIIFGTGYKLNLPFLSMELRQQLELSSKHITLANHTFHPDVPNLAFMGLWGQIGPYLPVLEQQARYLAYSWSGLNPQDEESLRYACKDSVSSKGKDLYQHVQTIKFARLNGSDPEGKVSEQVATLINDHPVTALTFKLVGPDAMPDAYEQLQQESMRFGLKPTSLR
ncbi:flavin-containing monooxygenase [Marinomonas spartinae]|uniref:flavin-containing monooxygenase n=1 Tax=Marinomonas spartinae TaxID=1792290 RepID=UPI0018F1FC55|nr:NAD(P)/FAD-dependent oxidoreductase [Marinomonas spartinae]MBJ7556493.1 NAD(P)/FAD-dependent oxidoreductase [Marinomonas spartinae]